MPTLLVVGHLQTTSKNARQQVVDQFAKIVDYSKSEEPGVIKYAITVPRDSTDETTIFAIEEYADQKVSDDHIASSPVQKLISIFGSQPAVLAGAPKVYQLEYTSQNDHFTNPEVQATATSNQFIVFATARQPSESATTELTNVWSKVVAKARVDEPSTLMYGLFRNKEDATQIGTVEAYADQEAFDAHCKSEEVAQLVSKNKEIGGEMGYTALQLVTGWLSR